MMIQERDIENDNEYDKEGDNMIKISTYTVYYIKISSIQQDYHNHHSHHQ
jgi:hypothetical protein